MRCRTPLGPRHDAGDSRLLNRPVGLRDQRGIDDPRESTRSRLLTQGIGALRAVVSRRAARFLVLGALSAFGAGAVVGMRTAPAVPGTPNLLAPPLPIAAAVPAGAVPRFVPAAGAPHDPQQARGCSGNAAGAAWADIDSDGRLDLYLPEPAGPGQLWMGRPGLRFERRALADAGIPATAANAASFADYDNDGRPDLYIAARGVDRLLHNDGRGRFSDVTARAGTTDPGPGTSAAWADFDRDGRLDLYVSDGDNCGAPHATPDHLYRNLGNGRFADVTRWLEHDGASTDGIGLQATWFDADGDGDPDLYLANDDLGFRGNELWRNDGPGSGGWRFTPIGRVTGTDVRRSSMGAAPGDLNGDGTTDLVVSDMGRAPLVLLRRGGRFTVRRMPAFASRAHPISWGVAVADFDNNGTTDLLAAAGALGIHQGRQPDLLYLGDGAGRFALAGPASGIGDSGRGRGVALADVNRDGLLAALIARLGEPPLLLVNHGPRSGRARHWIELALRGTRSPRDPCGAVVVARGLPGRVIRTLSCGSDGAASADHVVHIGLGAGRRARLEVRWPSGHVERVTLDRVDRIVRLTEPG